MGWLCKRIKCTENNGFCLIYATKPGVILKRRPPKKEAVNPIALAQLVHVNVVVSLDGLDFKKKPKDVPKWDKEQGTR